MLTNKIVYGMKNFYKQLGLSKHFTMSGYMRRLSRTYPKAYKVTRFGLTFTVITSIMTLIIPGCHIPLQKQVKFKVISMVEYINRKWYLDTGIPDGLYYINFVGKIGQYMSWNQLLQPKQISKYMGIINEAVQRQQGTTNYKNLMKIQNIVNGVKILNMISQKEQSLTNKHSFLSHPLFVQQYKRIVQNSIRKIGVLQKDAQKQDYTLSLKILQYLLRIQKNQQKIKILNTFIQLIGGLHGKSISHVFIRQEGLKSQMKRIFQQDEKSRPIIMKILALVEQAKSK